MGPIIPRELPKIRMGAQADSGGNVTDGGGSSSARDVPGLYLCLAIKVGLKSVLGRVHHQAAVLADRKVRAQLTGDARGKTAFEILTNKPDCSLATQLPGPQTGC